MYLNDTSTTLFVFNPEHDLCLANGSRYYVPPSSALDFARSGVAAMRVLYGSEAQVIAADDFALWQRNHPDFTLERIVPWGWDARLKQTLLAQGCPSRLLPDDAWLDNVRRLQGRETVVALQHHSWILCELHEVEDVLQFHPELVLKSPWSGAGRGLRWISRHLTMADRDWLLKVFKTQHYVVAERRFCVKRDFAIEYNVSNGTVECLGYSLFKTQSGVYRYNELLPDATIKRLVGLSDSLEAGILRWIELKVAPLYEGPLGVDLFCTDAGDCCVSEMNLRHTMGQVAHQHLQTHPEDEGRIWIPPISKEKHIK